jgi:hypothetical protein
MKPSPVQLLQSTIDKIAVESNDEFDSSGKDASLREDIVLQVKEGFQDFAEYWDKGNPAPLPGLESRTYLVSLGIRTDPEDRHQAPYSFELAVSGIVACMPEMVHELRPEEAARQYGLAMIYGAMREQLLTVTSRMMHGPRLLPTVSFMEPPKGASAPEKVESVGGHGLGKRRLATPKHERGPGGSK